MKMNELSSFAEELRACAANLADIVDRLETAFGGATCEPEKPAVKLEDVRAVLAALTQNGYSAAVRNLLGSYGACRLSEVDPAHYEALLKDAEAIHD